MISTTVTQPSLPFDSDPRVSYESKEMEVGKLKIRPQYQRPLNEKRVDRMVKNYDDALAGTLEVSFAEGHYWVVDGQHRLAAMRQRGIRICRALIHYGLTIEDEARLFGQLNTQRTAVTARDLYRSELLAGTERSIAVRDALAKYGLFVSPPTIHNSNTRALQSIQQLWELQSFGLIDLTLKTVMAVWTDVEGRPYRGATEGRVLAAIGRFIRWNQTQPNWSQKRLETVLAKHRPDELIADARAFGPWATGSRAVLYRWYNRGLSVGKLIEKNDPRELA